MRLDADTSIGLNGWDVLQGGGRFRREWLAKRTSGVAGVNAGTFGSGKRRTHDQLLWLRLLSAVTSSGNCNQRAGAQNPAVETKGWILSDERPRCGNCEIQGAGGAFQTDIPVHAFAWTRNSVENVPAWGNRIQQLPSCRVSRSADQNRGVTPNEKQYRSVGPGVGDTMPCDRGVSARGYKCRTRALLRLIGETEFHQLLCVHGAGHPQEFADASGDSFFQTAHDLDEPGRALAESSPDRRLGFVDMILRCDRNRKRNPARGRKSVLAGPGSPRQRLSVHSRVSRSSVPEIVLGTKPVSRVPGRKPRLRLGRLAVVVGPSVPGALQLRPEPTRQERDGSVCAGSRQGSIARAQMTQATILMKW